MKLDPANLDLKKLDKVDDEDLGLVRNEIKLRLSVIAREQELLKSNRAAIDKEFMDRFTKRHSSGTRTSLYVIGLSEDTAYPEVFDRNALRDHILRTKDLHLLQWRVSSASIQEEFNLGKSIPGVRLVPKKTITQRKR